MAANTSRSETLILKRPFLDKAQATELARSLFGFHVSKPEHVKEFESYDDRNFYVKGVFKKTGSQDGNKEDRGPDVGNLDSDLEEEFVLKILNRVDSTNNDLVDAQNEFTMFLSKHGVECPVPVQSLNGDYKVMWKNSKAQGNCEEVTEAVRLLKFVPGELIKDVPCTPSLLRDLGRFVARFSKVSQEFYHPAVETRVYHWDLQHIRRIKEYIFNVRTNEKDYAELLKHVYEKFTEEVLPCTSGFSKQVIQGDLNESNILVVKSSCGKGHRISGILDFGDMCYSYRLFEVGICMAYMIFMMCEAGETYSDAIHTSGYVLGGYQEVWPLSQAEIDLLYWTVAARICQSLAIGENQSTLEPGNVYLQCGLNTKKELLKHYVNIPKDELKKIWTSLELT